MAVKLPWRPWRPQLVSGSCSSPNRPLMVLSMASMRPKIGKAEERAEDGVVACVQEEAPRAPHDERHDLRARAQARCVRPFATGDGDQILVSGRQMTCGILSTADYPRLLSQATPGLGAMGLLYQQSST